MIKLESGRYYTTRDERKAYVAGLCPFEGVNEVVRAAGWIEGFDGMYAWGLTGRWSLGEERPYDLVAEWEDSEE